MFKKLLVAIGLIFTVCIAVADLPLPSPETLSILKNAKMYRDAVTGDEFMISRVKSPFKNGDQGVDTMYEYYSSSVGAKEMFFRDQESMLENAFRIPDKPIYIAASLSPAYSSIRLMYVDEALNLTIINFFFRREIKNPKIFLSNAPIARNAFKEADITLTKEQIDSFVEFK